MSNNACDLLRPDRVDTRAPASWAAGAHVRALAFLLLIGAAPADAQPAVRQVLVLHSLERGNLSLDLFIANFRFDLEERAGTAVNVIQVVVGPTGLFVAPEQAIVDFVRARFTNRPNPDLIVTLGGPAATFARKHRAQIFPETPLLLASVDEQFLGDAPLGKNETAVAVATIFPDSSMASCSCFPRPGRCSS